MISYLTSHIGGSYKKDGEWVPTYLCAENGFLDSLKMYWMDNANILIISSDADAVEVNDSIRDVFAISFPMSGFSINRVDICDKRNECIVNSIGNYEVVILAGGHVPTQNAFFRRIRLKEQMKTFDGILIGISAGTMNSAEIVYAQPELEGESTDQDYQRFLTGLGITKIMILPHYQAIKDNILDGQRLFEDITFSDSYCREFYALVDGSYFIIENGNIILSGEAYLVKDGNIRQICEKDKSICVE